MDVIDERFAGFPAALSVALGALAGFPAAAVAVGLVVAGLEVAYWAGGTALVPGQSGA